ncbi:MAG: hypothetical protein CR217_08400 [Beijerinckiaceae bacterium]|nr:MAG: hypothetical protein CR217_08400 [Beijerinckiaceae bacterium]
MPDPGFYFLASRCRYIPANLGLSTIFSPGAAGRHTLRRSPDEKTAIYSRCDLVQPLPHALAWSARDANGRVAKARIWQ